MHVCIIGVFTGMLVSPNYARLKTGNDTLNANQSKGDALGYQTGRPGTLPKGFLGGRIGSALPNVTPVILLMHQSAEEDGHTGESSTVRVLSLW